MNPAEETLMFRTLCLLGWLLAMSSLPPLRAQTAPVPPPEAQQFDSWIGEWEVFGPRGNLVGHRKIEMVAGGFALLENWTATTGNTGRSLNSYNRANGQWQQSYVGSAGRTTEYKGGLIDSKMVLVAEQIGSNGISFLVRGTWRPNPDGTVFQQFENPTDGGKTWQDGFAGLYKRCGTAAENS